MFLRGSVRRTKGSTLAMMRAAAPAVLLFCVASGTLFGTLGVAAAAVVPDMLGRAVAIPDRPLRVVSLAPSITEATYVLDRGDWLVGVTDVCDYPSPARQLPRVGGIAAPNLERIVRLRPDLVIATAEGNARDLLDRLERLGLSTFALKPDSYAGVVDSMLAMGRALVADRAARRVVEDIQRQVRRVQGLVAGRSRPRVLYLIWTDPLIAAGAGTYLDDLLGLAGGRNMVWERTGSYPRLNWEQVVARVPDVILLADHREDSELPSTGSGDVPPEWRAWQAVPAIRTGRVLAVPSNTILRPGPRLGEGLTRLARAIHPEAFAAAETTK